MEFENKVILITGASSGIGKEIALNLSSRNCKLILVGRRKNLLNEISSQINLPENVLTIKCDVRKKDEVFPACDEAIKHFGKIDIALLNAGISIKNNLGEINSNSAMEIFETNFMGQLYWIERLLPDFKKKRKGTFAVVSSIADARGFSGSGFYCASKAALTTYLEGLRAELTSFGINVVNIKPGFVRTPLTENNKFYMPFLMNADKAAAIIIRGLEKEKKYIKFPLPTVIGANLLHCIPDFLFDFLARKQLRVY